MIVYHDEAGEILYTLTLAEGMGRPAGSHIEIPDQQLDLQRHCVIEGQLVLRGALTAALRDALLGRIRQLRGELRARYITVLPGQDMVYLAKEVEARDWLADPAPDPVDYPMIAAEIPVTGEDGHQVAQVWANMAALWRAASAQIEAATLTADAAVRAAETLAEAETAMQVLTESLK